MTKIMLVEDDKSLREIYGIRLIAEGYEITSAGDGEEALAMAIKERPNLIISDVMMPKISGFDMLDILRATPETKDIKVIMMTALSSEDQRTRGESLGANRYLVKSQVGIEDVVRTVHEVLSDAPGANQPVANQSFGSPAPATLNPNRPLAPAPQAAPTPAYTPQPIPAPQPQSTSMMPQPTAPFSSPAPASLVDSIIRPQAAVQTPAPRPAPAPFTPRQFPVAPVQPQTQAQPAPQPQQPVFTQPVVNTPNPAAYAPAPVVTAPTVATPTPTPAVTPIVGPSPVQYPQPTTAPAPISNDISEQMARELSEGLQALQTPNQNQ